MADFDLKEALLLAKFTVEKRFEGCKNTAELKDTLVEMFGGDYSVNVIDVEGRPEKFKASLLSNIRDKKDVSKFPQTFMANTKVTLTVIVFSFCILYNWEFISLSLSITTITSSSECTNKLLFVRYYVTPQ